MSESGADYTISLGRRANVGYKLRIHAFAIGIVRAIRNLRREPGSLLWARNLDMAVLALALGRLLGNRDHKIVYEVLDVHEALTGEDLRARTLRRVEALILRNASTLVVSSPAYITHYFGKLHDVVPNWQLVENRLTHLPENSHAARKANRSAPPPWSIVWTGTLRCRQSLEILSDASAHLRGRLHIALYGKSVRISASELAKLVSAGENIEFLGPYNPETDLANILKPHHFSWCVDLSNPSNSSWLLPNRFYEACAMGVVPLAVEGSAAAELVAKSGCGAVLPEASADALVDFLESMDFETWMLLHTKILSSEMSMFVEDDPLIDLFSALDSESTADKIE